MLHEILPHRFDNGYRSQTAEPFSPVLCYFEDFILLKDGVELQFPQRALFEAEDGEMEYLFSVDEEAFFLLALAEKRSLAGFTWVPVRSLRLSSPYHYSFAAITGHHLFRWYLSHRYCGACASIMVRDKAERMLLCETCGNKAYPHIMPAVIVGIIRGNSLLMTKYADRPHTHWALVAGFCEIGESFEETVAREVLEETGLYVKHVTYYKSQPWPYSGSLLAGFFCETDGNDAIKLDQRELAEAVFVPREAIDVTFDGRALTNEMICCFRDKGADALIREDDLRQQPYPYKSVNPQASVPGG